MADISVIIPVYNEEKVIGQCLESLGRQTLKPKEIIIVDDQSIDNSVGVIERFAKESSTYQRINALTHSGAGAARNLGVSKATGQILVFVDADMTFSRTFLADLTAPIREGKLKGTFSKLEYIANWNNRWARFWNYAKGIFEPRAISADYPDKAPVFRAVLKSEFDKVGGFDESKGYNDDWSLSEKLGIKAAATKAGLYHNNPESLSEAFIQARWTGRRKYKFGFFGGLIKEFPLWSVVIGMTRVIRERGKISDNLLSLLTLYPLFLLIIKSAATLGAIEFAFRGKPSK